ncbi:MAG: riboflavin synthase, partial [Planctomycetaceae bacterium]
MDRLPASDVLPISFPPMGMAMFTGIVEGQGRIFEIRQEDAGIRLILDAPPEMADDLSLGDSIAINGCCLTVVAFHGNRWEFQAGAETLSKTNLGTLQAGSAVNLERSLPANGRIGGHFVQGHVDGTARIDSAEIEGDWVTIWFRLPAELARQLVPKGSVAVDGISLTVVEVEADRFSVALIPHTLEVTTLGIRRQGDVVNIETDI